VEITIFCDGASKGNPGPGGWGAIVSTVEKVVELGGAERNTTNNRMELLAAVSALEEAFEMEKGKGEITVHTDSSYVINGITKWVQGWQSNGWLTKAKQPVMNQDLWEELLAAVEKFEKTIEWQYVGGHVGIAGNERVDTIASDFAEGKEVKLYKSSRANYTIDIANINFDEAKQKVKSASSSRSKAKAYSYVSLVDDKVLVHKSWAECEARVKGKPARFKKALNAEEEKQIIAEFSK
jgi:ribonuclease HI